MQRPSYAVVTICVTGLAVFGLVTHYAGPLAPPEPPNALEMESGDFLRQASRQRVDWKLPTPEAFALARRLGKPIMFVVGTPWSEVGRRVDERIFADPEVAAYLSRHFISIRVDGQERPEWLATYMPLSRPASGALPDLQIWFLDAAGRLFSEAGGIGSLAPIESNWFQTRLRTVSDEFDSLVASPEETTPIAATHAADMRALATPGGAGTPDFDFQDAALAAASDKRFGGFPFLGRTRPRASTFGYLLLSGQTRLYSESMEPLIRTGLVDWPDGGFFAGSRARERATVDFDKVTVQNAEMVAVLALGGRLLGSGLHDELARRTFDALSASLGSSGLLPASRIGDEGANGRSERSSFSPRELRENLSAEDREWTRWHLGLRVEDNPMMSVIARDPAALVLEWPRANAIIERLRRAKASAPRYSGEGFLHVNGFACARLAFASRLWNDSTRSAACAELFDRLEGLRAGDDVRRSAQSTVPRQPYLGDYLAYADAALNDFLLTGRVGSYETGLRVLKRARFLFETEGPGIWFLRLEPPAQPGPQGVQAPEVLDFVRESCTAQAIRLLGAYGRLAIGSGTDDGPRLQQAASSAVAHLAPVSRQLARFGSGYFAASLAVLDDGYAIAVGEDAHSKANELFRKVPRRLVAAAVGPVRPDLQARAAGIYVVRSTGIEGPMGVLDAARLLGDRLAAR